MCVVCFVQSESVCVGTVCEERSYGQDHFAVFPPKLEVHHDSLYSVCKGVCVYVCIPVYL